MNAEADGNLKVAVERERAGDRDVTVMVLDGDFDLPAVDGYDEVFAEVRKDAVAVVVDTTGVRFVDSSGLNALARSREAAESDGFPLAVVVAGESAVDRVLDVSGLTDVLDPAPDRAAAIAALR